MKTPSEPAPSTGLTTALKSLCFGADARKDSTSSFVCASCWPHALSFNERTASVCKNLFLRSEDFAVPLVRHPSASDSWSPRSTPVSQPTSTAMTRSPVARTAATVLSSSPFSCCTTPAYATPKPLATKPRSSTGTHSDHTHMTRNLDRWTIVWARTAPVEIGSTTTTVSAPGVGTFDAAAAATASMLADTGTRSTKSVSPEGSDVERAMGVPPSSHSRYVSPASSPHEERTF
mmetsp:Transcript_50068/g.107009  ORF Transcript_50068/g.107009 Transcript_50068/m.107009 type:complete len:233 (+) Transcript_50068:832-1530(+)